jgi:putative transcriptional regulator
MGFVGKVLIAHPNLDSPFFRQSVIFVYEDIERQGSQGIILNKPSRFPVKQIFEAKGYDVDYPEMVHRGGPINEKSVSLLHSGDWTSTNTYPIGNYSLSSDQFMIEKMSTGNAPTNWRLVGGVCGWGPGQLQAEIEGSLPHTKNKNWLTVPTTDRILFEYDGDEQWRYGLEIASQQMVDQYF